MIGTILIKDISFSTQVKVDINKQYDYITIYSSNSGNNEYLQVSDDIYLIYDLDTLSVIGAKIMDFYSSFSLQELASTNFKNIPNVKSLIKQIYTDLREQKVERKNININSNH